MNKLGEPEVIVKCYDCGHLLGCFSVTCHLPNFFVHFDMDCGDCGKHNIIYLDRIKKSKDGDIIGADDR